MNYEKLDKVIWLWLASNGIRSLDVRAIKHCNPVQLDKVFKAVFEKKLNGEHVRAAKATRALRLRALAYRRRGVKLAIEAALGDLARALEPMAPTSNASSS